MKERLFKHIFDLVLTSVLLIALAPIFILIVILLKLEGLMDPKYRGPVLYRETRISRGRPFQIYKFRTVCHDILEGLESQRIGGSISQFTSDARLNKTDTLTPVGRMLARIYFDELPQLFNILKGDMSLVGPRPLFPDHYKADLALDVESLQHIKAGLFGLLQASKGDQALRAAFARMSDRTPAQTRTLRQIDQFYFDKYRTASSIELMRLDLWILWKCLLVVLKAEGI